MSATKHEVTRTVRFQVGGGWRFGEVVSHETTAVLNYEGMQWDTHLRVRDPLTGDYWNVPSGLCQDITGNKRDDEGNIVP
jgi:hypothetical protein